MAPAPTAPTPANPNDASINTSRSNIKHGSHGVIVNPSTTEQKQEPSKAPLPSGYAYDANGRIVANGIGGVDGTILRDPGEDDLKKPTQKGTATPTKR